MVVQDMKDVLGGVGVLDVSARWSRGQTTTHILRTIVEIHKR